MADIKKLKTKNKTKIPSRIECAVFNGKKECLAYILMRHGYSTDGSGIVQWNSLGKLRADTFVNGTIHQELRVLEYVEEHGTLSEEHLKVIDGDGINITNLARLTDDMQVRAILGISGSDCLISSFGEQRLLKIWQRVIEVIIDGRHRGEKFTVDNNINNTKQRQKFINEIIVDVEKEYVEIKDGSGEKNSETNVSAKTSPVAAENIEEEKVNQPFKKQKTQTTSIRKGLIPKSFNPTGLKPQKVINICDELKKIDINAYPHCVGAMFRILIEFGIEDFLKAHTLITPKKDNLVSKITAVADYMQSKSILTKKDLKPIRGIISNPSNPISTDSLNAYVHNVHVSPKANELKIEWDNIQHFMEEIWK